MTLPNAYQWADDQQHYVCAWCPDKEEAEKLVEWTESKKECEEMILWGTEYIRKKISHTICNTCLSEQTL